MRLVLCSTVAFFSTVAFSKPSTCVFSKENNSVEFTAHAGFLFPINGKGGVVNGMAIEYESEFSAEANVALEPFDTGIDLRNDHFKNKYMEIKKYPAAELLIKRQSWMPKDAKFDEVKFNGLLKLKGATKPVSGVFSIERKDKKKHISAQFVVHLSDYPEIEIPRYKGVVVSNDVEVRVNAICE